MNINFNYKGSTYRAGVQKETKDKIVVRLNDNYLGRQFGSLHFSVNNKKVDFNNLNPCHSDLFALQSTIKHAIAEQAKELL
jgi:hypothetical protein